MFLRVSALALPSFGQEREREIDRERDREMRIHAYAYIYIYIHTYIHTERGHRNLSQLERDPERL